MLFEIVNELTVCLDNYEQDKLLAFSIADKMACSLLA